MLFVHGIISHRHPVQSGPVDHFTTIVTAAAAEDTHTQARDEDDVLRADDPDVTNGTCEAIHAHLLHY